MIARLAEHGHLPADLDPEYVARHRAWIAGQPGFCGGYHLLEPETGHALSLTMWQDDEALAAADRAQAPGRDRPTAASAGRPRRPSASSRSPRSSDRRPRSDPTPGGHRCFPADGVTARCSSRYPPRWRSRHRPRRPRPDGRSSASTTPTPGADVAPRRRRSPRAGALVLHLPRADGAEPGRRDRPRRRIAWAPFALAVFGALVVGMGAGSALHLVHSRRHPTRLATERTHRHDGRRACHAVQSAA